MKRWRTGDDPERGSMSALVAVGSFALIACLGLGVDLTGQVRTEQNARAIASEAARAGGQQISAATIRGDDVTLAVGDARAAALAYLASAGVDGTVEVTGGDTVTVTVSDTYEPYFLGIIGVTSLPANGTVTARAIRTMGDQPT